MKRYAMEFVRRGLAACGLGPLVLAVIYLILDRQGLVQTLDPAQVSVGIFSLTALAFLAGGMNVIYQLERLPLMAAVTIHGGVLYFGYLAAYLVNGWLEQGRGPILVFTAIFVIGYLLIWAVIYAILRRRTRRLNQVLKERNLP